MERGIERSSAMIGTLELDLFKGEGEDYRMNEIVEAFTNPHKKELSFIHESVLSCIIGPVPIHPFRCRLNRVEFKRLGRRNVPHKIVLDMLP